MYECVHMCVCSHSVFVWYVGVLSLQQWAQDESTYGMGLTAGCTARHSGIERPLSGYKTVRKCKTFV